MTYRIIGADGKEYGPISAEVLRQWIAEGRADGRSRVLLEGTTDWRPLSEFSEFGLSAQGGPPPLTASMSPDSAAAQAVSGPAIALMITAILGFLAQGASLAFRMVLTSFLTAQPGMPPSIAALSGTLGVAFGIALLLTSVLIFVGAMKMKSLQSYGLAMTASIIALIPCTSPCCLLGLPIGIWALVVLAKPEVKSAFR